jgi:hypothetical protein
VGLEEVVDFQAVAEALRFNMIRLRDLLSETETKKDTPYMSGDTYISKEEAKRVYDYMGYDFDFNQFVLGMNVELEHQDVTDGSLVKTAMIAAAHLREVPDYYTKLKKYVEPQKITREDEAPTGGIGLVLPGGYINGAPKPKDVKKMRKHLNKEKDQ